MAKEDVNILVMSMIRGNKDPHFTSAEQLGPNTMKFGMYPDAKDFMKGLEDTLVAKGGQRSNNKEDKVGASGFKIGKDKETGEPYIVISKRLIEKLSKYPEFAVPPAQSIQLKI